MKCTYLVWVGCALSMLAGCVDDHSSDLALPGDRFRPPRSGLPPTASGTADQVNEPVGDIAARYQSSRPEPPERLRPFGIEGLWVPSGWMGDAEAPGAGVLKLEVCDDYPHSPPACEKWSYAPALGNAGWVAVGYQYPPNNWGSEKGMDLSRRGFTTLTFWARGEEGGERIIFKSGGHNAPGAKFPATYESTCGVVTLDKHWRQYSIPLNDKDLSNTPTAFAFSISVALAPQGSVFYLDDVEFRGREP